MAGSILPAIASILQTLALSFLHDHGADLAGTRLGTVNEEKKYHSEIKRIRNNRNGSGIKRNLRFSF